MMKKFYLVLVLAGIAVNCFGQNPVYEWAKQMGGSSGYSITVNASGKVYTIGQFWGTADFNPGPGTYNLVSAGDADVFISRLNDSGNFSWAKRIGGPGYETGNAIALDGSGNVYVAGYFYGTVDFDPGSGVYNITASGTYEDIFVCKLNNAGNFVWARKMGGTIYDRCDAMAVDADGNVYTTGHFYGTADFDPGITIYNLTTGYMWYPNTFVSKLDANGNFVWAKSFTGTDINSGLGIAVDLTGNVYTTGSFSDTVDFDPGGGFFNLYTYHTATYISKLDVNGNFIWVDQVTNVGSSSYSHGRSIDVDNAANVYTIGAFSDTADFNQGPGTYNLISNGLTDIFVLKLDSNGNYKWAKEFGSATDFDSGTCISTDNKGNVYTTGNCYDTVDFDPGPGTFILTSSGANDIFISKLDSSGNFVWAKEIGGPEHDGGISMATDTSGTIWITGKFRDTVDFNPPFSANLITDDDGNIFVAKYSQANTTGIFENVTSENFSIFPNPSAGTIQLTLPKDVKGNVEILNMMGEGVYTLPARLAPKGESTRMEIDVSFLAKGIYMVKVGEQSRKLVIE